VGSPAAEVHRQVYAEHEHLHAHSSGTYTTAGSSRGDGASGAATGSPAARWVYGIRRFPRFQYGGEMTGRVGHRRQWWGLDKGAGSEALTSDGRRSGQSSGGVAVPSFSRCSCARRRVRVVGGCCSRGESRGKRRMEELTGVVRSAEMKPSEVDSGVGRGGEVAE
jgi:hypothetical protein